MRLSASQYKGEPVWGNDGTTSHLQNLMVDPFSNKHMEAQLMLLEGVQSLEPTELCELHPAEDSFLELGKSPDEAPEEVAEWDGNNVLLNSKVSLEQGPIATIRLITSKNSTAWFELVVVEGSPNSTKGIDRAISLSMDIEVGNGSWESSLVRPEPKEGAEDKDLVSFDLVIAWEHFD